MKKIFLFAVALILALAGHSYALDINIDNIFKSPDEKAFEIVQKAKAPVFLSRVANNPVDYSKTTDKEAVKKIGWLEKKAAAERLAALYPDGFKADKEPKIEGYSQALSQTYDRLEELIVQMKLRTPAPPFNEKISFKMSVLKDLIPKNVAVLEYYTAKENSTLFVLTRSGFKSVRLGLERSKLEKMVDSFVQNIESGKPASEIKMRGKDLLSALGIDKIGRELKGKDTLVIAPHGPLHKLPFHALTQSDDEYLIENYKISIVPSATAYYHLRFRKNLKEKSSGDAYLYAAELLPDSKIAVNTVKESYNFKKQYINSDFTLENLFDANDADIIHINTPYSIINDKTPLFSQFFAWDKAVYEYQIENKRIHPYVMVLDFPGSGSGRLRTDDDIESFARSFLEIGADSVVVNVNPKNPKIPPVIWGEFYKALKNDDSAAAAYRRAILKAMENEPVSGWAYCVLMGAAGE